jgi:hypothetical protein
LDEDDIENKKCFKTSIENTQGHLKCNRCKQDLPLDQFKTKKNGIHNETCSSCLDKTRCKHSRLKTQCKECKGASISEHIQRRYECKECKGEGICEHIRIRSKCKECKRGNICEHMRQRSRLRLDLNVGNLKEEVFVTMVDRDRGLASISM